MTEAEERPGLLLGVKPGVPRSHVYARTAVLAGVFLWTWWFVLSPVESNYAGRTFLHLVNLPFHEAGHVVFRVFGSSLLTSLGGSLGQLIMPLVCMLVLLLKTRDPFGASMSMWWLGESFQDLAPYMADARVLSMPLLGGNVGSLSPYGFHDWNYILTELHMVDSAEALGGLSAFLGSALMLLSVLWGASVLWKQYGSMKDG